MTGLEVGRRTRDAASRLASFVRAVHTLRREDSREDAIGWHDASPIGRTPLEASALARDL
jgi:hypothetical protein